MKLLIKNVYIVTMNNNFSKFKGNIVISDDKIEKISEHDIHGKFDKVIDGEGLTALPGFVQPHIHLCQTLFRGSADDMELMDWLKKGYGLLKVHMMKKAYIILPSLV